MKKESTKETQGLSSWASVVISTVLEDIQLFRHQIRIKYNRPNMASKWISITNKYNMKFFRGRNIPKHDKMEQIKYRAFLKH